MERKHMKFSDPGWTNQFPPKKWNHIETMTSFSWVPEWEGPQGAPHSSSGSLRGPPKPEVPCPVAPCSRIHWPCQLLKDTWLLGQHKPPLWFGPASSSSLLSFPTYPEGEIKPVGRQLLGMSCETWMI